nr:hypothetical protein [Serratia marcescens]
MAAYYQVSDVYSMKLRGRSSSLNGRGKVIAGRDNFNGD